MAMNICERCRIEAPDIHDYCKHCSKNLCDQCIAEGNCYDAALKFRGHHEAANHGSDVDDVPEQRNVYNFGDVALDSRFWDCECRADYIHPKSQPFCSSCQTSHEEQPDSRADEVASYFPRMAA